MPGSLACLILLSGSLLAVPSAESQTATGPAFARKDPFQRFQLPPAWTERFWSDEAVRSLLDRPMAEIASLVPKQAGFRFCRCPSCGASERDDPLRWSILDVEHLTCRRCQAVLPNDQIPARLDGDPNKPVPVERVQVGPTRFQSYPYHILPADKARYPGERVYVDAKRDYEVRTFLAKLALYAALAYRDGGPCEAGDPRAARLSAVLILRFAQVYPEYAVHYDQPDQPKYLQPPDLRPPYRMGFQSGKWDWTGAWNVPLDLAVAYGLLRGHPALLEAGKELIEAYPARQIEEELFRPSGEFLLGHPDPANELSIHAARGLLVLGRLLRDQDFLDEGLRKLDAVSRKAFYHDGTWREGTGEAQRRILGLLDGWFQELVGDPIAVSKGAGATGAPGSAAREMLARARRQAAWSGVGDGVELAGFRPADAGNRKGAGSEPRLLGGAGVVRMSTGAGAQRFSMELRAPGDGGPPRFDRLSLRVLVGGVPILDGPGETRSGWERMTVGQNTIVVDGLNQRERPEAARHPAPAGDILFHAVDPVLQVATVSDPWAYPSTSIYRQTLVMVADRERGTRYGLRIAEVRGGTQHDLVLHATEGVGLSWQPIGMGWEHGPPSLLPPSIVYLPDSAPEDGRWFVQSYGAFDDLIEREVAEPAQLLLRDDRGPRMRVHLLEMDKRTIYLARTGGSGEGSTPGRDSLIVRKRLEEPGPLESTFVTMFEALGGGANGLSRVGRFDAGEGMVGVVIEGSGGADYVLMNRAPGTEKRTLLPDGRELTTDGLVIRVSEGGIWLAGGTFARLGKREVRQSRALGTVAAAMPAERTRDGTGWFLVEGEIPEAETDAGRTLLIRHGDGRSRAWTIRRIERVEANRFQVMVEEEPGFTVDRATGEAVYYQFPGSRHPGPHAIRIGRIAQGSVAKSR